MKKNFFLILFILYSFPLYSITLDENLRVVNLEHSSSKDVKVLNSESSNDGERNFISLKLGVRNLIINLEVLYPILPEKAEAYVKNNFFLLLKSFESIPTPYVGQITKKQNCLTTNPPQLVQEFDRKVELKVLSYFTDESRKPGSCPDKHNKYEGCQSFFFLHDKKAVFKIQVFVNGKSSCSKELLGFIKGFKF